MYEKGKFVLLKQDSKEMTAGSLASLLVEDESAEQGNALNWVYIMGYISAFPMWFNISLGFSWIVSKIIQIQTHFDRMKKNNPIF